MQQNRRDLIEKIRAVSPDTAAQLIVPLLSSRETAELLEVEEARLRQWRRRGTGPHLPPIRLGRTIRYRVADVVAALKPAA